MFMETILTEMESYYSNLLIGKLIGIAVPLFLVL
jgi:hypothetical protein